VASAGLGGCTGFAFSRFIHQYQRQAFDAGTVEVQNLERFDVNITLLPLTN
jgi:hypothetical protein